MVAGVAEFGRRKGLKIPRQQWRAGSSPASGTISYRLICVPVKGTLNAVATSGSKYLMNVS